MSSSFRFVLFLVFLAGLVPACKAQSQPLAPQAVNSPQAGIIIRSAVAALSSTQQAQDVTMSGTARRVAGSEDESGNALLKLLPSGQFRMDLAFQSGQRSEVRTGPDGSPDGAWLDSSGGLHKAAQHNLFVDAMWYFPGFALSHIAASSSYAANYAGRESRNGISVEHMSVYQQISGLSPDEAAMIRRLSQTEIYLDATTFLPVAVTFNTHPDDNANLDIPVELRFSDYKPLNGAPVASRIQKYVNNSLVLDIHITSLKANTGLTSQEFSIQ